ncbi:outer membrane protein assembly factor BamE [Aeoliella mucimassa]|uniref:Lipoprotein SmpA/OmlA domain-containing protein n=1 Tax=Aeoliella mucimassa TaxID=2527972 RepID=A0A518AI36_9BACT|nr:outer membrane protein assembly factor BamE [Aeoliella mucimassa]QDU54390.1 hypothetical protein Pan181_05710 [Aeoliella mucimassa]
MEVVTEPMKKTIQLTIAGALLLVLVSATYVILEFDKLPLEPRVLQQLQVGMTRRDVEQLVPPPTLLRESGKEWVYIRRLSWPIITLRFSDDDQLAEVVVDR